MDAATAKELLAEIKQADFSGLACYIPGSIGSSPTGEAVQKYYNQKLQGDAVKTILKALGIGAGVGAAVRGVSGLQDYLSNSKPAKSPRIVELPVPYPKEQEEKQADNQSATNRYGLNYFMPSLLLGTPLAAYGGWKAVDSVLNAHRKAKVEQDLEEAKKNYEAALIGAYKKATENALENAFESLEKSAFSLDKTFPNLSGAAQGAALTYIPAGLVGGYAIVDHMMRKGSKREILRKAIEERARRHAAYQPAELYAVPFQQEEKEPETK